MPAKAIRYAELAHLLRERRQQLQSAVRNGIREERDERAKDVGDVIEDSDALNQVDLEFALLQMKAETMARLDEALLRLEAGRYGSCGTCGNDIPAPRLRALPFAVRCQSCEARREAEGRGFTRAARRDGQPIFPARLEP